MITGVIIGWGIVAGVDHRRTLVLVLALIAPASGRRAHRDPCLASPPSGLDQSGGVLRGGRR